MSNQPKFGEWIKCSERLPEPGEPILIYDSFSKEISGIAVLSNYGSLVFVEHRKEIPVACITHWTPLPEVPK